MYIIKDLLDKFHTNASRAKILIVGDVMLDRYWFGDVTRISPEAPVPIVKVSRTENKAGGAANVALNIASLGGTPTLLSVVGQDEAGQQLRHILQQSGIKTFLQNDATITTTVKLRMLARNQQLLRADFEETPSHEVLIDVLDEYKKQVKLHDIIILSDYAKGGLQHIKTMIDIARNNKKYVLVDPKGSDYMRYKGANIITPNRQEFQDALQHMNYQISHCVDYQNEETLLGGATHLITTLNLDSLLLTRSEQGMSIFSCDNLTNKLSATHYDAITHEVYDVSGAGDTVIASLALAIASDIDIQSACVIANMAASIVVGKVGTASATIDELRLMANW